MLARLSAIAIAASLLGAATAPSAFAKPTEQAKSCAAKATEQKLKGAARKSFLGTCNKGSGHTPAGVGAGTMDPGKESQAVTKPSGATPAVRSAQCNAEADKRGLKDAQRNAFRQSCIATAGPVTEGETGTQPPKPANQIKGIGVNAGKKVAN